MLSQTTWTFCAETLSEIASASWPWFSFLQTDVEGQNMIFGEFANANSTDTDH
jgi:hypothetical protein